jgi:glycosyltransferase involved in cell wall biosynthesis
MAASKKAAPRRIAWVGPTPTDGGGATFVGTQLLLELARAGVAVDCFIAGQPDDDISPSLRDVEGLEFIFVPKRWSWGRWYSRTPLMAFFSGHLARGRAQSALADEIATRHAQKPYDLVYQFSQSEYTPLRRRRSALPPIVVHPSTHAAGELRWVRREHDLARRAEPLKRRAVVEAMLAGRALVQRYELPRADRVLGVSRLFAEHLRADYRIPAEALGVVPNPVDLELFQPGDRRPGDDPVITLLYVSRISARKGLDQVAALSHRLQDLEGRLRIRVFGGPTLWSNYMPLLADLNPAIAAFEGQVPAAELAKLYQSSDGLLQPSLYEPFGLTAAEALASGLPVVVSDEVGAADGVDPRVCRRFPAGDVAAFERQVRDLVDDLRSGAGATLQAQARAEASRLFAPPHIGEQLVSELSRALEQRRAGELVGVGDDAGRVGLEPLLE